MYKYIVKAFNVLENRIVTFNQNITPNYQEAKKFAKHLKEDCSEYYKNITLTSLELKIIKTEIEEF